MSNYRVVVIGASAGGVEALVRLVEQLPLQLNAAIFVAVHFPAGSASFLPDILSRAQTLPAVHPHDGEAIRPGRIYVAPPDYHLLVHRDAIELSRGPRENGHRPAIDVLFRSAAQAYGPYTVGVVLTGMLDDGTSGLQVIKALGGVALVQDPEEAMFRSMPENAIAHVPVDRVLPLTELANHIVDVVADAIPETPVTQESSITHESPLAQEIPITQETPMTTNPQVPEEKIVLEEKTAAEKGERPNAASPFTCPDCGGVLWELQDAYHLLRFRCHIGHAYSLDSLMTLHGENLERALWTAVRAIEERAALSRRLMAHAYEQNRTQSAEQFSKRAMEAESNASLVRQLILNQKEIHLQGGTVPETVQIE
ncbi:MULTISPECIES: chemotaxis protein CheB [Cyanophyceae]|uniref:chemotaxis protein CheB n=1 Tax=Cyanophyceae TaxID=3028117 RepID=UPI001685E025|nr:MULTISPECIES: chemotaxis protein CheB [Cyanophyceae]MBD1919020.1 chemotaxis protein CheB [Phormidium sp. FACHB-77]MBD2031982.1 chemotaxis protein CheB [Phormidium sp. FACHB-322]MBD2053945.1 chemotaxis protein CheB [Leptolyngbya sp. FACHB-60]